ncbi:hypothetical protein [Bacillus pseudomycoides]|uniref:hypothetical protein n=1 Tax=Bacillus pseudomycoides TaxID=64104 RepID=UPI000BEC8E8F|nr:hypothetical protein [Bacillus pseudomycoides]PED06128.1 hypothetical protein COO19_22740 [Bacillus pseudomycoides]PEI95571.1 hypothetical protein CN686_13800 [Bacillus pseudomycoides]PEK29995.1 hypothetical protein CN693_00215 [Bacillus pseudomycoides]PEM70422.1 hypothetical protein CN619_19795 [Bacillus pseudomycoides]PEO07951.1 hypothetical protein CN542_26020 [Bacillus pseudomycoides]
MTKDHEFINLVLNCEHIIKQNIPSNPDDANRYQLMLEELKSLRMTIKLNQLNTKMYYLSITQMLERDDPEEVLQVVLKLNKFYCTYYQNL